MNFYGSLVNVTIQFAGLFGVQYLGWNWAIIPSAFLLSIIIVVQTISAGALFSKFIDSSVIKPTDENTGMRFLVALLYAVSIYQIYLFGYSFFAGIAAIHIVILILSLTFRSIKRN